MSGLARRRALVIGAHRGAGAAAAAALAGAGAALVCADRRLAGETVATIRAAGGRAETWQCDIADEHSLEALFDALGENGLPLDIVVAALAPPPEVPLPAAPADFDRALGGTLRGAWLAVRAAASAMSATGGRIVLVLPDPGASALAGAARAALAALVPAWAREAGAGVVLAAVAPEPGAAPEAAAELCLLLAGPAGEGLSGQVLAARAAD